MEYISKQSKSKRQKKPILQADLFADSLKSILKMASIDFVKAVIETGYMDKFYEKEDYEKLDSTIDEICQDLKRDVFGKKKYILKEEWMKM